jgi:ribosomal protein S18 acetylase RimI-like enzyme
MSAEVSVRRARPEDLERAAELAGELVRLHHATDPGRFFLPDNVEQGYAWWFRRELARPEAVILVAARDEALVGYAYGTLEERNWNLLLDVHGALHDLFVVESARRSGIGKKLVEALVAELEALGAGRFVLNTMVGNEPAQRLFAACGFRPTLLEMTRNRAG